MGSEGRQAIHAILRSTQLARDKLRRGRTPATCPWRARRGAERRVCPGTGAKLQRTNRSEKAKAKYRPNPV